MSHCVTADGVTADGVTAAREELVAIVGDLATDLRTLRDGLREVGGSGPDEGRAAAMAMLVVGLIGETNRALALVAGGTGVQQMADMAGVRRVDFKMRQANDHSLDDEREVAR